MKNILIKTALVATVSLTACSKNQLEIEPTIPIATVDAFYKNEAEALAGVNAAYIPLSAIYNGAAWHLGDIMSDDTDLGGGGGGDGIETAELDNFNMTAFNPILNTLWAQSYYGILRSNIVVTRVPTVPGLSQATKNKFMGQGYFLRALYYFHLVRIFGDVPLYTNIITAEESTTIARSPKAQVLQQIVADLKQAETLLPATNSGTDAGRATSGSAKGLLASVYLWMNDKTNAAAKAKEVIDNRSTWGYDLQAAYADNFDLTKENGKESLFEVQYRSGGG